jgi:hypothetical protein
MKNIPMGGSTDYKDLIPKNSGVPDIAGILKNSPSAPSSGSAPGPTLSFPLFASVH